MHRPWLERLSNRCGIEPAYHDIEGRWHEASESTRVALLAGMGWHASTEEACQHALGEIDALETRRALPPSSVRLESDVASDPRIGVRLPEGWAGAVSFELLVERDDGSLIESRGRLVPQANPPMAWAALAEALPLGLHDLELRLHGPGKGEEVVARQRLLVVPERCFTVEEALGNERGSFGLWANLYSIRGPRNWGFGDLGDLAELVEWAGGRGADFVGLNPLHALWNRAGDTSPYYPLSRRRRNELYLDLESIPELADASAAKALLESDACRTEVEGLRTAEQIDYERVLNAKRRILEVLYESFSSTHLDRDTARGRAYRAFREREGPELTDYATFVAAREASVELAGPRSAEAEEFRRGHEGEIAFQLWVQFELDRQLAQVARSARDAGMRIGLYQDLALGSDPGGADVWAHPERFADRVTLGAPPDAYNSAGQNWAIRPQRPRAMAEDGYREHAEVLAAAFAHSGAVRIDHIMGFDRQFWIPEGRSPAEGAYVRLPGDELFGVLALLSRRHRGVVVGEDLGTVPAGFRERLASFGILSSRVVCFERDGAGEFRPAEDYPRGALVTVNTHDLIPLEGYVAGRDLDLRQELGEKLPLGLDGEREQRASAVEALDRRLEVHGAEGDSTSAAPGARLVAAHHFLARTPCVLAAASLDDVLGEFEPVNVPGVSLERHPSWARRMRRPLSDLAEDADVAAVIKPLADRRRS